MNLSRRKVLLGGGAVLLAGCASPDVADYAREQPPLVLEQYFNGRVDAWGMVTDRSGKVVRRFSVEIDARWDGPQGTLDERFVWSDGERQRRVWRLRSLGDGRYTGEAEDVVGTAQGQARGNALQWRYTLAVPVDGRVWHVDMDDWMYLVSRDVLINRTTMRKWGVRVAEITIAFTRRP